LGTETFTVDSVVVEPNPDFALFSISPNEVIMNDTSELVFRFAPLSEGTKSVWATVYTSIGTGRIRLTGEAQPSGAVDPTDETAELMLYPNPARDILSISADPAHVGLRAAVRVTDVHGAEVLRSAIEGPNAGSLELDVRSLSNGTYFLELQTGAGETLRRKFTISR
ncbi:MAG TPA: T9SS type A sorting domain-containing protein, partial [Candidatus Kapabacteria bacterium]|nr:T9SS type A sorting domain-containing protein [Candidatus Kapabacteria bacterium]